MEGISPNHILLLDTILDANGQPMQLPIDFIKSITDNFSEKREIGRGGFGVVYKGELQNRNIAVKKVTLANEEEKAFDREMSNLMRVQHENIVRFLGYCNDVKSTWMGDSFLYTQQRILCFEYIGNGCLSDHIHDELRGHEWHTRYKIIKEICKGLHYLHNKKNLVHRDLKPDNILIDNLMVPKIADLGISKVLDDGKSKAMATNSHGTRHYAGPEFGDTVVSVKYDIYSLGLIIIELVTGFRRDTHLKNVLRRWRYRWNKSNEELRYQQVAKCIKIGLSCQHKKPKKRPFIMDIIKDLEDVDGGNAAVKEEIPCWNELLWVEPPELFFPFEINKQMSCGVELNNKADAYMAFYIKTDSDMKYAMDPNKGVIQPRSQLTVSITLLAQEERPEKKWNASEFTIKSRKVNEGFMARDMTKDIFSKKSCNTVDKMLLGVVFDAQLRAPCMYEEPKNLMSVEPLDIPENEEAGKTSIDTSSDLDKKEPQSAPATIKDIFFSLTSAIMNYYSTDDPESSTDSQLEPQSAPPPIKDDGNDDPKSSIDMQPQVENVDALIQCVEKTLGFCEGKPVAAITIYKCLLHWRSFEAENSKGVFDRLIHLVGSAIENEEDNDNLAYWLSNTSSLLFLLQRSLKSAGGALAPRRRISSAALQALRSAGPSNVGPVVPQVEATGVVRQVEATGVVRQVQAKYPALLFKQQLTAYVEKIYGIIRDNYLKELSTFLSLCIQEPRKRRGMKLQISERSDDQPHSNHWQKIRENLDVLLKLLRDNHVLPVLAQKIFIQIFSFINVQIFNSFLLRRECCCLSNGEYVKAGIAELELWCEKATNEYASSSWDEIKHIRQAVAFFVMFEKHKISYDELVNDLCPILSVQQLYRICTMYWVDKNNTQSVSSDVLSIMRVRMTQDNDSIMEVGFLLDHNSSIPFLVEDITNAIQEKDFSVVKPALELRENPAFQFLQD